jgi:hypothetical protein
VIAPVTDDIENLLRAHVVNPFFVLALPPAAPAAEVERQAQRLLSELAAELAGARRYRSPFGEHERTPELVRSSAAELRDPARRLRHEWWARGMTEPG